MEEGMQSEAQEDVLLQMPDSGITNLNIICRLCANPNDRIIGIYSEEGISNDLANKMNLYLPVKVSENDTLPLQCCWSCASTVLAWHELVLASVEADRRLRGLEEVEKPLPSEDEFGDLDGGGSPIPDERIERSELKSSPASLSVFCQELPMQPKLDSKEDLQLKKEEWMQCDITEESLQKYIDNIDPFECKRNSKSKARKTNKAKKIAVKTKNVKKEETGDTEYSFSCQYCALMFINEEDILEHVKQEHPDKEHEYNEEATMMSKKEKRKNTKLDPEVVNAAKVVVDGRVYYNCKICGKSLHSPYTYIWHMRIHTGERPYVCDLCGKQFRVSQGLVRHLRETHEGIKNFGCDICGRMFATRRNVEEHRRIHTNERPYICDLCGKSFKQKASLFVHNRSHTDSFPFRCSYCNQGFRTRPPLLIHVTRHTGEKPYPCDVCGRCFRIKYELKRHKLIHSEDKPFSCTVCGLSFRQKRYLRNHNKINHNLVV